MTDSINDVQRSKRDRQERSHTNDLSNKPRKLGSRDSNASSVVAGVYLDEDADPAIAEVGSHSVEGVDIVNQYTDAAWCEPACKMGEARQGRLRWWNAIENLCSMMSAGAWVRKTIFLRWLPARLPGIRVEMVGGFPLR